MKLIAVIIAIAFLLTIFASIVNAQENPEKASEAKQKIEKQPRPIMQVIYWLAILILAYAIAQLCTHSLNQIAKRRKKPEFILRWLLPILRGIIYGFAFYIVFSGIISRIEPDSYVIIGALVITFGLVARDWLSSLFGGFVIFCNRSFRIGNRIKIDGYEGEVTSMGLCNVKVMTFDGQSVIVPNSMFFCRTIRSAAANVTHSPVEVEFILPGSIPLEQVEKIAKEAVLTSKYVYLAEPVLITSTDDFRG